MQESTFLSAGCAHLACCRDGVPIFLCYRPEILAKPRPEPTTELVGTSELVTKFMFISLDMQLKRNFTNDGHISGRAVAEHYLAAMRN